MRTHPPLAANAGKKAAMNRRTPKGGPLLSATLAADRLRAYIEGHSCWEQIAHGLRCSFGGRCVIRERQTRREAMSYDLFFKPRRGDADSSQFAEYFRNRRHYKVDVPEVLYENEDTGVYFMFDLEREPDEDEGTHYPVALNLNYFRPSFFGLEAEPEVTAFVRAVRHDGIRSASRRRG